ncbi:hypothetical protein ALC62_02714 [Cyphomyrmex costatus]|uniref:Uncharacterized protein n=1 Tax=Cyphomyrmex costatus TaxID=456900 RepID=A0A195D0H9_9HYME|nr:hypothetical protein ALC62_02714 [Cyphomyrmex costatus]
MICRGERAKITRRSWRANEPDVSASTVEYRRAVGLSVLTHAKGGKVKNKFTGLASEFQKYKGPLTMGVAGKKAERTERENKSEAATSKNKYLVL